MKNKNTIFSRIARFYSGIDTRARWYIWGAVAGAAAGLFFLIFEPFYPWHAPCIFLFFGAALWCAAAAAHRCGYCLFPEIWKWISSHKKTAVAVLALSMLIYISVLFMPIGRSPFRGLSPDELSRKIQADYDSVCGSIPEMDRVMRGLRAHADLFRKRDIENITLDERRTAVRLWAECARIIREYDKGVNIYRFFYRIPYVSQPLLHSRAFFTGYVCFVSRYAFGSELIQIAGSNPVWEKILNEGVPEQGIPRDFYSLLKYNIIHVNDVIRLTAGYGHLAFLAHTTRDKGFLVNREEMLEYIKGCVLKSTKRIAGKSLVWFPKNGIDIFKRTTFNAWFPIQKQAARTTGHIRFTDREANYITAARLKEFRKCLRPGDILVERRNWYMSNMGIPGFWPHAALYTGTREGFLQFFSSDPGVIGVLDGQTAEQYIRKRYPRFWDSFEAKKCVIEALEPGVVLQSLEKSAGADYTAALRPLLSKKHLFLALCGAFSHFGKPYDFNFDFVTDSSLVCTELVYKAYLPGRGKQGIAFDLVTHAGRKILTANNIVKTFDEQFGTSDAQLDFAGFLDYDPVKGCVTNGTAGDLRKSWKRTKWDILLE